MKLDLEAKPLNRIKERMNRHLIDMDVMLKDHETREEIKNEHKRMQIVSYKEVTKTEKDQQFIDYLDYNLKRPKGKVLPEVSLVRLSQMSYTNQYRANVEQKKLRA